MQQLTAAQQIQMALTDVSPAVSSQLKRGGVGETVHYFPTLDHGVEWCEEQILAQSEVKPSAANASFTSELSQFLADPNDLARIMPYLERLELAPRTQFLNQGELADALYFIDKGKVSVELHLADGKTVRLRTIRHGTVVGEVAMYLGSERTASVVALEPTIAYRLSATSIMEMERKDPDLAAALHKWIASVMAERLADNVRTLEAVMD
jgi:SulP family sulfate permease